MSPDELRHLADLVEKGQAYAKCDLVVTEEKDAEGRIVGEDMRIYSRMKTRAYEIRIETYTPWTAEDDDYLIAQRAIRRIEGRRGSETYGMRPWNVDHWRRR